MSSSRPELKQVPENSFRITAEQLNLVKSFLNFLLNAIQQENLELLTEIETFVQRNKNKYFQSQALLWHVLNGGISPNQISDPENQGFVVGLESINCFDEEAELEAFIKSVMT